MMVAVMWPLLTSPTPLDEAAFFRSCSPVTTDYPSQSYLSCASPAAGIDIAAAAAAAHHCQCHLICLYNIVIVHGVQKKENKIAS